MSDRDRGGRGRFEPPLPKPYEFVPFARRIERGAPAGHQRVSHLNGTLHGQIIARSPLHVASGLLEQTGNRRYPMVKAHFRTNGTPVIPATSLKGCMRSILEAISPSVPAVTRAPSLPRELEASHRPDHLDVAQRIFGALGYQGQVRFSDAVLESGQMEIVETPALFRPRPGATGAYEDRGQLRGRKFYMHGKPAQGDLPLEACTEGSTFSFQIDFENLTPGELGLLLTALGLGEPRLWPKLGGGKPVCLGTVEVINARLELEDATQRYADFDVPPARAVEMPPYFEAMRAERLILNDQLRQLAATLRWPRDERECPDRSY